jgi:N-methylhydantoinase B/oxoprolinase/acetone carboxylase alpha subunit
VLLGKVNQPTGHMVDDARVGEGKDGGSGACVGKDGLSGDCVWKLPTEGTLHI